jgi:hypothetical protein
MRRSSSLYFFCKKNIHSGNFSLPTAVCMSDNSKQPFKNTTWRAGFTPIKKWVILYPNRSSVSVQRSGARLFGVGYTVWYHRLA